MNRVLLVAGVVVGLSGTVEAENNPLEYNLPSYDICAGLLLSVAWKFEAAGNIELSNHYQTGADTHGTSAAVERHILNDPTDTHDRMLATAHAFANLLDTEETTKTVRQCDAMVPILQEVNRAWDEVELQ